MAARRCCGIDYPTSVFKCPICGEQTDWMTNADPDPDWERTIELRQWRPSSEDDRVERWRIDWCLHLGYDFATAMSIAVSDADLHMLDERLIRRGCPLDLAARII